MLHNAHCILEIREIRVFFESESYSVLEDGGSVNVCVRRSGMITETFSVRVATINVEASGRFSTAFF